MVRGADVVVIGSGGFGAATAYFLMQRGGRRVALLDRHELASQISPRAAGNAAVLRSTDVMSRLAGRAVEWLLRFTGDTGEPLDIVRSGSLKAARTEADAAILAREAARGQGLGLGTTLVSADAAHRMHPFFQPRGVRSVVHTPGDVYFEPSHVASGYAAAAGKLGATLLPHTTVTGVHVRAARSRAWRRTGAGSRAPWLSTRPVRGHARSRPRRGSTCPCPHTPPGAHHRAGRGRPAGAADRADHGRRGLRPALLGAGSSRAATR